MAEKWEATVRVEHESSADRDFTCSSCGYDGVVVARETTYAASTGVGDTKMEARDRTSAAKAQARAEELGETLTQDMLKIVACPRCGSMKTERISEFGSTPCKASYRCTACAEPFDYFKCI